MADTRSQISALHFCKTPLDTDLVPVRYFDETKRPVASTQPSPAITTRVAVDAHVPVDLVPVVQSALFLFQHVRLMPERLIKPTDWYMLCLRPVVDDKERLTFEEVDWDDDPVCCDLYAFVITRKHGKNAATAFSCTEDVQWLRHDVVGNKWTSGDKKPCLVDAVNAELGPHMHVDAPVVTCVAVDSVDGAKDTPAELNNYSDVLKDEMCMPDAGQTYALSFLPYSQRGLVLLAHVDADGNTSVLGHHVSSGQWFLAPTTSPSETRVSTSLATLLGDF